MTEEEQDDFVAARVREWMLSRSGTRHAMEAAALSVEGVTRLNLTEHRERHAVELEIEADTLDAAKHAAERTDDACPPGIVFTWIPAGPAAQEAIERALATDTSDWRPDELAPEDHYGF